MKIVGLIFVTIYGLLISGCAVSPAQEAPQASSFQSRTMKTEYSQDQYLNDIDELVEHLTITHPQPFEFVTEKEFSSFVAHLKSTITDETTLGEFVWIFDAIIAKIGCSHTKMGYFNQEDKLLPTVLRFPLEVRFVGQKLFILDPLVNGNDLAAGDEVTLINGVGVTEIQSRIYDHIPTDGNIVGFKQVLANAYNTSYIAYALGFPDSYMITTSNSNKTYSLDTLEDYSFKPLVSPKDPCQETLCFRMLKERNVAIITIRSSAYYGERFPIFRDFVDRSFNEAREQGIGHLIIDYRGNSGGSSQANAYLLRHIADHPFVFFGEGSSGDDGLKKKLEPSDQQFEGPVYVLSDGGTQSSTGHTFSIIKDNGFAILVGEESGSTFTCNDNSEKYQSTYTGLSYQVARNTFFTSVQGLPNNVGVLPDHQIVPQIDDIINERDAVLDYALKLVDEQNSK